MSTPQPFQRGRDVSLSTGAGSRQLESASTGGGAAGFAATAGATLTAQQRYNGRRINIDVKDADVHNILRLLAGGGGVILGRAAAVVLAFPTTNDTDCECVMFPE